ncbi:hypothetical protein CTI12_AA046050 [Artemisia annua]|uniref:Uncharacterized protein n=1 Tax=Artemisia annua TaxID=35608 RepID=A0A2U1PAD2_ARTAN|nr:hypothetical protein CTI12_AA046050 [Artemisia annua]
MTSLIEEKGAVKGVHYVYKTKRGLFDEKSKFGIHVHRFGHDNKTGEKVAMLTGKWAKAMYNVLEDPTTKPKGYDLMTEVVLLWERDKFATKTRYNHTPFATSGEKHEREYGTCKASVGLVEEESNDVAKDSDEETFDALDYENAYLAFDPEKSPKIHF